MATITRPYFQLPSTSTPPVDQSTPLPPPHPPSSVGQPKRSLAHYPKPSFENYFSLTRSRSVVLSSPLSGMAFCFREKAREKELALSRTASDVVKASSAQYLSSSPLRSATPPIQSPERPSTPSAFFAINKPKALKKKISLASLLSAATEGPSSLTTPEPARRKSSDSTDSSTLSSKSILTKTQRTAEEDVRREEYPQSQLKPKLSNEVVRKTTWSSRCGMKVLPSQIDAAYMQAYDPVLLENDRYLDILLRRLNPVDGPSFHEYGQSVPYYVLDLGCGSGHWLLEAASVWGQSLITGFDLVDVLTPDVRGHDRIRFVHGNFLQKPWPFPDGTFDLVRMANLSLCIPRQKWEMVLSEVQRVLTIYGRLELIDDEMFFPYAPVPIMRPSPSVVPKSKPHSEDVSFFETDEDSDDDTLEGVEDSYSPESTIINDWNKPLSPLFHGSAELTRVSENTFPRSPPLRDSEPTLLPADGPCILTSTSADTITLATANKSDTAYPSAWNLDAAACRDLETVFENMLNQKFGIHTRPSEFILDLMKKVFGNGKKLSTYHLELAPKEVLNYFGGDMSATTSSESESDKDEKLGLVTPESKREKVGHMINEITKPWEEKRLFKKMNKVHNLTGDFEMTGLPPDVRIPEGLSPKAAGRLGIVEDIPEVVSRIPDQVSAKAAFWLGIPMSSERKDQVPSLDPVLGDASDDVSGEEPARTSVYSAVPLIVEQSNNNDGREPLISEKLSVKAASRLGISYSALTAAAAASRRPLSSSSTLVANFPNSPPFQSPGLLVWPSKFIPLPPSELEMHACKNIHTLLGCKAPLADYIATFVDENGSRLETDEEFDHAVWGYECFRRRRFNWPSDIPDWDLDPDPESLDFGFAIKPVSAPKSAHVWSPAIPELSPVSPVDMTNLPPSYTRDQLTHVRTLRVYEAVKTGEHALSTPTLSFSLPPIPITPCQDGFLNISLQNEVNRCPIMY